MKFKFAPREENYDFIKLVSENGRWELGIWSVMFGKRVRCGLAGECYVSLDYCAGNDPWFQLELLNAIHIILQEVPEDISVRDFEDMFPKWDLKPINLDPHCWPELVRMRDAARARLGIVDEFYPLAA